MEVTVDIVVSADTVGTATNTASVVADSNDPDLTDNTATEDTTIIEPG